MSGADSPFTDHPALTPALAWLAQQGFILRAESGCSDCGRRLILDSEVSVSVCRPCQDVFLRSATSMTPTPLKAP